MNQIDKCIMETLRKSSSPYVSFKSLRIKCGKNVKSKLTDLEKKARIVSKGKKYALPERVSYVKGIFDGKKGGYGFLMPDNDMEDIFIPPNATYTALNGDFVLAEKEKKSRGRWTGRVVSIIQRKRKLLVGQIIRVDEELMFEPQDRNIPYYFEIQDKRKVKEGDWVLVKFVKWTTPLLSPLVKFVSSVSKDNLYDIIVKQEYNLKHEFPSIVLNKSTEAYSIDTTGRENLTGLTTITIDPSNALDFDDAVSIKKEKNNYHLWVHIADVPSIVKKNSVVDEEAYDRGCTTYLPNDTYFMLPEELTNRLSLREGKKRPSTSVHIVFNAHGKPIRKEFFKSIISSDKRFDYQETQDILDGKTTSPFDGDLKEMSELANILTARRERMGYLDFATNEVEIKFKDSKIAGISPKKELWTHRIIEKFMVSANEAVAEQLHMKKTPAIYRTHEEPDIEQLIRFKELAKYLGLNLKSTRRKDIALFLTEIKGTPHERTLNYELLRCMKRARYIAQAEPHYGLASELYTHFTSPIRRYPDLVVQRILFGEKYSEKELKEIAAHSTEREWKADEAEREITKFYILRYIEENKWQEYRGTVVDVAPNGIRVELDEFLISGFIPIKLMPPDNYKIKKQSLSGRQHSFKIGELLLSRVYTVSPETGELILDYSGKIKKVN